MCADQGAFGPLAMYEACSNTWMYLDGRVCMYQYAADWLILEERGMCQLPTRSRPAIIIMHCHSYQNKRHATFSGRWSSSRTAHIYCIYYTQRSCCIRWTKHINANKCIHYYFTHLHLIDFYCWKLYFQQGILVKSSYFFLCAWCSQLMVIKI